MWQKIKSFLTNFFGRKIVAPPKVEPSLPTPTLPIDPTLPRLGIVIGHDRATGGATMPKELGGMCEYEYNGMVAEFARKFGPTIGIDVVIYTRDIGGIYGAYSRALKDGCDCIVELHFNACDDPRVMGCEVLCSPKKDDQAFAKVMQDFVYILSKGKNRGVKVRSRGDRGALSVYSAGEIPNCLLEPFFGSSVEESSLWLKQKEDYAHTICLAAKEWFKKNKFEVI